MSNSAIEPFRPMDVLKEKPIPEPFYEEKNQKTPEEGLLLNKLL